MHPLALNGNLQLAAAVVFGLVTGFVLMKSDLVWRDGVYGALGLRDGRLLKTVLLALAAGLVGFYFAAKLGLVRIHVPGSGLWNALGGGALCGIGLLFAAQTPAGALVSLASGKFYVLWVILGMALAIPAAKGAAAWLGKSFFGGGAALAVPAGAELFSAASPLPYLIGGLLVLIVIIHFTVGDPEE